MKKLWKAGYCEKGFFVVLRPIKITLTTTEERTIVELIEANALEVGKA